MARHEYRLIDVFTAERFGGNPLAVFPLAAGIAPTTMQRIARELNLSETTFVLPTTYPGCDFQVRIFTPLMEVPMAGHPTVGTAWVLDRGERITFLEGVGPIVVERATAVSGNRMWSMTQPLPRWGAVEQRETAAALLGVSAADIEPNLPIQVMSSGLPFLFVPVRNLDALARVRLQMDRHDALMPRLGATGVFCFTLQTADPSATVRSRMFAPQAGVTEDPATGSASGPLGCYLVRYGIVPASRPARMVNLQGVEIGRPSRIHIEIDGSPEAITTVRVAGECVAVGGGYFDL